MEKRTMGTLMAAMRKARGLTQQQVADRLGVSNKTVSKWECDDGCPDIAMLPAIAEIYGITVDELLRGEVNGEKQMLGASAQERTEKQKAYLLNSARMRYRTVSIISVSIGVLSPVAAVVVGYSFYRCFLSLGASVLFMLAALIVQAVGVNKYWFSLRAADIDDHGPDEQHDDEGCRVESPRPPLLALSASVHEPHDQKHHPDQEQRNGEVQQIPDEHVPPALEEVPRLSIRQHRAERRERKEHE